LLNFNGSGPFIPASGTGVRIYAVGFIPPPPDVSIVLTPATTPIVIPPGGGSFNFNIAIANNELTPQTVDIWTMITLPSGNNYGPIINVQNFTLAAGFAGNRDRTQNIPGGAPAGAYVYHGYVGQYPDIFYDQDEFPFTKSAIFDGSPYVSDWANWGENFEELVNALVTPEEFALHNAYPNPFNPATSIMYDLPEASNVKLVVYDLNGRIVANLVDGWMGEGSHSVVFNADNLPSGVYFCSLTAGNFTATKKLLLIK
jgi:hypothetical protein